MQRSCEGNFSWKNGGRKVECFFTGTICLRLASRMCLMEGHGDCFRHVCRLLWTKCCRWCCRRSSDCVKESSKESTKVPSLAKVPPFCERCLESSSITLKCRQKSLMSRRSWWGNHGISKKNTGAQKHPIHNLGH